MEVLEIKTMQLMCLTLLLMTFVECEYHSTAKQEKIELKASENIDDCIDGLCGPQRIKGLTVTHNLIGNHEYNIHVTWSQPKYVPDSYVIEVHDYLHSDNEKEPQKSAILLLNGNETSVTFKNVTLRLPHFAVTVKASRNNFETFARTHETVSEAHLTNWNPRKILIFTFVALSIVFTVVLFFTWHKRLNAIMPTSPQDQLESMDIDFIKTIAYNSTLKAIAELRKDESMEVNRSSITVQEILGDGAFGRVHKGIVSRNGGNQEVAVKMLDSTSKYTNIDALKQFYYEISVMKSVGTHPNVVSIFGHCTTNIDELMLLREFCNVGCLLDCLRQQFAIQMNFYKKNFDDNAEQNLQSFFTSEDLIWFARQVSDGMDFLARQKVVHRDLAARNILVCSDKTVKVADFGLSRDIYQEKHHQEVGHGKVPIKWLAVESMTHHVYTSQSDVWSFGILLYEIVTLGATPYPSLESEKLPKMLTTGYRMAKPLHCHDTLYDLMMSCWHTNPTDRPSFEELSSKLNQEQSSNLIDLPKLFDKCTSEMRR